MPYPSAPALGLAPNLWLGRWKFSRARLVVVADMLLASAPGLALLLPHVLLQAPDAAIEGAFALGALCLLSAALPARQRLERDETVRIHARFWDRLIETPLPAAKVDDTMRRSFRLNRGLDGALALAKESRRLLAPLLVLLMAVGLLTAIGAWTLVLMLLPALAIAFLLERAALATAADAAQARHEFSRKALTLSLWMPGLRQLGADTRELCCLRDQQHRVARCQFRARILDRATGAASFWFATATLATAMILDLPAEATGLSTLLLSVPATYAAAELGRGLCRIHDARERIRGLGDLDLDKPGHDGAKGLVERIESVMLEGTCFRHDMHSALFSGFSIAISRGEIVALTGPSGCGKSTLLDLLMGLKQPQAGTIAINGELRDWGSLAGYRARIAGVFQDMPADVVTVRGVIAKNAPRVQEVDLLRAVADAGLETAIAALPMGLQTLVVEGAFAQSFHQQLLIAGALAQDPDLLVLDETFSSLDHDVVAHIVAAVRRRGMALVFASHRTDLVALADRTVELAPQTEVTSCPRT